MDFPFISKQPGPEGTYPKNLYMTLETESGVAAMRRRPGLLSKTNTAYKEGRGLYYWKNHYYAILGNTVYRINASSWAATLIGTLLTTTGFVDIAFGATQLLIVDGIQAKYQAYGASSLTSLSDVEVKTAKTVAYQDGYFVVPFPGTDSFYISGVDDVTSWSSLDEGKAGRRADDILVTVSNEGQLLVAGETTLEWYWNSGAAFPFYRVQGATQEIGIGAKASLATIDKGVCFLDYVGRVCKTVGNSYQVISTPEIDRRISLLTAPENAVGTACYWEGLPWYFLVFPDDGISFVFDLSTQSIMELTTGNNDGQWRGLYVAQNHKNPKEVPAILDYQTGDIYEFDKTQDDNGDIIRMARTMPLMFVENKHIRHDLVELRMKTGLGSTAGSNPLCELRYSDDYMETWSNYMPESLGKLGKRDTLVSWDSMGISERRVYEWSCSENVNIEIYGAVFKGLPGST